MLRSSAALRLALLALAVLAPPSAHAADDAPRVELRTNLGPVLVELWPEEAPETVENFLGYVRTDFYDGVIFHRVIPYFMVQTGGYDADLEYREPRGRVPNESVGGPRNLRGTLAMARQRDPDSADSQFFVNVEDNDHLDADGDRPGYTVFGRVVEGMDLIDRISRVETTRRGGMADVPVRDVVIEEARVLEE